MPWTRERLEQAVRERLDGARLVAVANREPYIHTFDGDDIRWTTPASGLTSACTAAGAPARRWPS